MHNLQMTIFMEKLLIRFFFFKLNSHVQVFFLKFINSHCLNCELLVIFGNNSEHIQEANRPNTE